MAELVSCGGVRDTELFIGARAGDVLFIWHDGKFGSRCGWNSAMLEPSFLQEASKNSVKFISHEPLYVLESENSERFARISSFSWLHDISVLQHFWLEWSDSSFVLYEGLI